MMGRTIQLLSTMTIAVLLASGVALAAVQTFPSTSLIRIGDHKPANPYP
jgi:hypothetical protein